MEEPGLLLLWLRRNSCSARVGVDEHAVLWPEDVADAFAGCDDIESHDKIVIHESNAML